MFKVTYIAMVPTVAVFLAKQPVEKQFDLSSLQWIRLGAGTTNKDTLDTLEKKFNMPHIYSGFGMTETTWMTHCNRQNGGNRKGSIGLVQPFCESKVGLCI
jgi:acyl-CoA synthetase (AMP-forming)/AMP-acid ligase II